MRFSIPQLESRNKNINFSVNGQCRLESDVKFHCDPAILSATKNHSSNMAYIYKVSTEELKNFHEKIFVFVLSNCDIEAQKTLCYTSGFFQDTS